VILKILILSKDKISQNIFRSTIKNISEYQLVGTNSNQSSEDIKQRIALAKNDCLFFHALKKSFFVTGADWLPEPVADYPKILWETCDLILYTKTLFQGGGYTVLKGSVEESGIIIDDSNY
jgi:hypothetical protein